MFKMAHLLGVTRNDLKDSLSISYRHCGILAKNSGSNFYYGMLLTSNSVKRNAIFSIYAWMRTIDDIADSSFSKEEKINQLHAFFQETERVLKLDTAHHYNSLNQLWSALHQTILQYKIPIHHFKNMLHGQIQSARYDQFEDFNELYEYCYNVASTVGLVCLSIWGYIGGKNTEKLAEYLGIAMQLTNILRDIYPDASKGQLFIPNEYISNKDNHSPLFIIQNPNDHQLGEAIEKLIFKANYYYNKSQSLVNFVSKDGVMSLKIMTKFYYSLFKTIKNNPRMIFQNREIKLNKMKKLVILISCFFI